MLNSDARTFGDDFPFQYTIIIPAYNEEERIVPTLDQIVAYIEEKKWSAEIIVVDDGSTDATALIVSGYALRNPSVRVVESPAHRGKGHSVRIGVMNAAGGVILVTDADLPASMQTTSLLFQALAKGADIAIASRWLRPELQQQRQSLLRQGLSRCFNYFTHVVLGLHFKDTQCGVKAFTSHAASLIFRFQTVSGWAFDAELLVIAKGLELVVKEVPVPIEHDPRSRLRPLFDGLAILSELLRIAFYEICGRYPSPAAPSVHVQTEKARTALPFYFPYPRPVRVVLALFLLVATSLLVRDSAGLANSKDSTRNVSHVVSQNLGPPRNLRSDIQGSTQYLDQSFAAEEFDLASDQD